LEVDDRRVRILNEQGKEANIPRARVLTAVDHSAFPQRGGRDEQQRKLKEISGERDRIKEQVDLRELWEVVSTETAAASLQDLTDLVFGSNADSNSEASLIRAILDDRVYFKIRSDHVEVSSEAVVNQAIVQKQRERERLEFTSNSAAFLSRFHSGDAVGVDEAPAGLVPLLEDGGVLGDDWQSVKPLKEVFASAGLDGRLDPFRVLVKLGLWSEDENIRLRSEKVPIEFDRLAQDESAQAALKMIPASAEDMTAFRTIAIDAATTRDVDDALSLSADGDEVLLGIHITCVADFIDPDSHLDRAARERGTSIYMPDRIIPMLPLVLSENAASLSIGQDRPAISAIVRLGPDGAVKGYRIAHSVIRVDERLSYEEADARIKESGSPEALMFRIASRFRNRRAENGAIIFRDPELTVNVAEDGTIEASLRDRESPSQILVSELMILANTLFAKFMKDNRLPGIFRSQPPPAEKIELGDAYDPVISYRAKRALARGELGPDPAPHSTLGLDAYTTATSPLRRYPDLTVQRQIKSFLERGQALLDRTQIEQILIEISYPLERAASMERERQRYFLLRHLQTRMNEQFHAVVLYRFPRFYLVQINEFAFNAALNTPDGHTLSPYDRLVVKLERIRPREEKLNLSLIKVL
jgi:exoribonuclease-2